jgi:hypothetical protein
LYAGTPIELVLETVQFLGQSVHSSLADWSEKLSILLMVFEYVEEKSQPNKLKHSVDFE